jgi:hypothetical protein
MAGWNSLSCKHVETLLSSESEDDFDISGDQSDNFKSDTNDSDGRYESKSNLSGIEYDISIPLPSTEETKVN